MRVAIIIFLVLAILAPIGYLTWTLTPYYAFQEAGIAYAAHNSEKFEKYVDLPTIVGQVVQDSLSLPLQNSDKQLTLLQRAATVGSVYIASPIISKIVLRQVKSVISKDTSDAPALPTAPINKHGSTQTRHSTEWVHGLKGWLSALIVQTGQRLNKTQLVALSQVKDLADRHPESQLASVFTAEPNEKGARLNEALKQYGLTPANFRGIPYSNETTDNGRHIAKIGIQFFSPKLNEPMVVEAQLEKTSLWDQWKIERIGNLQEVITKLEPTLTADAQARAQAGVDKITVEGLKRGIDHLLEDTAWTKEHLAEASNVEYTSSEAASDIAIKALAKQGAHKLLNKFRARLESRQ